MTQTEFRMPTGAVARATALSPLRRPKAAAPAKSALAKPSLAKPALAKASLANPASANPSSAKPALANPSPAKASRSAAARVARSAAAGEPAAARAEGTGPARARGPVAPALPGGAPRHQTAPAAAADAPAQARATADPCLRPSIRRATVGWLAASLGVQVLCALFFVVELATDVFGLRHWALRWEVREALQVAASLGLILGAVLGVILLRQTLQRIGEVERQVAAASGAFFEVMDGCFAEWGLTPSEREVALFAVRGYSNAEIAETRGKSEATIKTQMNAVFRKAGVTGRAQLISQFVDVLIASGPAPATAQAPAHAVQAPAAAQPAR